ncbi:actin maturation protease [Dermacentor variabilis]|uniref:actin maturation protease n=1 Tax=Dermacentor variabilis TaxID=34621 RepID=UPI003F5C1FB9
METPQLTIPPPPPPPPPSLSVDRRSGEGNAGDVKPDTTVLGVLERQLHRITAGSEEAIVVSRMSPLRPVLQEGPQCGLVALSMASQLLQDHPVSVDTLFGKAKSLQFTKKGEMFSVGNMKALAETCLQNPCSKIVRSSHRQREELIRHLLEGKPAVIPYDSDGNFEPCLKRGHTAHWAVLHGICMVLQSSCIEEMLVDTTEVDSKCSRIFHIRNIIPEEVLLELTQLAESPETSVFVYASQGKSRHVGLWELGLLLKSNDNLAHFTPKHDISQFVIPEGGVAKGLSGQVLLFT